METDIYTEVVRVEKVGRWIGDGVENEFVYDQVAIHFQEYEDTINTEHEQDGQQHRQRPPDHQRLSVTVPLDTEEMPTVGDKYVLSLRPQDDV